MSECVWQETGGGLIWALRCALTDAMPLNTFYCQAAEAVELAEHLHLNEPRFDWNIIYFFIVFIYFYNSTHAKTQTTNALPIEPNQIIILMAFAFK